MTPARDGARTKLQILDVAERLFADHGFAATSLRKIIAEAGVNLAAVHYHFKSKEALLEAVMMRRLRPVNQERMELLDHCLRDAGAGAPSLECVLHSFFTPAFRLRHDESRRGPVFGRLMGRMMAEPNDLLPDILNTYFCQVLHRFRDALSRALPNVPLPELSWRMNFCLGAMAHTLRGAREVEWLSGGDCGACDLESTVARLVAFTAAGLRAPVTIHDAADYIDEVRHA